MCQARPPVHASEMYAKNIFNLLSLRIHGDQLTLDLEDEVITGCLLTHSGAIVHPATCAQMGITPPILPTGSDGAANEGGIKFLDAPDGEPDDLTKISGVASIRAQQLNDIGIYHYRQIAALDPPGVEQIDTQLKLKGLIQRENWIEQAKTLMGRA